jgi:hypothetical protein
MNRSTAPSLGARRLWGTAHTVDHERRPHGTEAPRPHERAPARAVGGSEKEQLDPASARGLGEHARRDHAGVVDDEAVAGTKERGQVTDGVIGEGAGRPIEQEEPGGIARGRRVLGDAGRGQVVVVVGKIHG